MVTTTIEQLYRSESARIRSTLIRLLGGFEEAEEVVQETFAAALSRWPSEGPPREPRAWLFRAARNQAIDRLRRRALIRGKEQELAQEPPPLSPPGAPPTDLPDDDAGFPDDRLRLIFTCCHPALPLESQIALTLHTLCGLRTEEIARAFLVPLATMGRRLSRAKERIRDTGIPYRVPPPELLPERLDAVMAVVYLVFNEGYSSSLGEELLRRDLCQEAIRLARLLLDTPGIPAGGPERREAEGLLALLLAHDARAEARTGPDGSLVLLEDQDRGRWKHDQIAEAAALVEAALRAGPPGPYVLQAAIATLHGQAARPEDTDWPQIAALYALLARVQPTDIVALNHAVAVAMAEGPERGLALLDGLTARSALPGYHLLPAARADLLRRLSRWSEATTAYEAALRLCKNQAERGFLQRRLGEVQAASRRPDPQKM